MTPVRILVVDDSLFYRKVLSDTLKLELAFEVVGTAGDGRAAILRAGSLRPDLVLLDVAMPGMGGLETLRQLQAIDPRMRVILLSPQTDRGAADTIEALAFGASDCVRKPADSGTLALAMQSVREEIIPRIKTLFGLHTAEAHSPAERSRVARVATMEPSPVPPERPGRRRIDIVAIGASTGGPNALAEIIPRLPAQFPVPIVIVQHMPAMFTSLLADRLTRCSAVRVGEAKTGVILMAGDAWIAPGDFHMEVCPAVAAGNGYDWRLGLNQRPPEHSCRPAVDVLFRSVAALAGGNVLGVVMTGMGADGVEGARQIQQAGGEVIVQDQASSVVWGMAGGVWAAGFASAAYPLDQLAGEITRRVQTFPRMAAAASWTGNAAKLDRMTR
jgi:two-component system chemotaxis response regulator CheB